MVTVIEEPTPNVYTQEDTIDVHLFQNNLSKLKQFTVCMAINPVIDSARRFNTFFSATGSGPRKSQLHCHVI